MVEYWDHTHLDLPFPIHEILTLGYINETTFIADLYKVLTNDEVVDFKRIIWKTGTVINASKASEDIIDYI